MPYYEYRCTDCQRKVRLFFTYAEYDSAEPTCPNCMSMNLRRLVNRVALAKSEESRLDTADFDKILAGLDEDDPKSIARVMRQMKQELGEEMGGEMGDDLGGDFEEVVGRLEAGESPEAIEQSMPGLADGSGGSLGGDLF